LQIESKAAATEAQIGELRIFVEGEKLESKAAQEELQQYVDAQAGMCVCACKCECICCILMKA